MAELADALDLGSSGRPWRFKSSHSHHFFIFMLYLRGLEPSVRTVRDAHSRASQGWHLVQFADTCHWQLSYSQIASHSHQTNEWTCKGFCPCCANNSHKPPLSWTDARQYGSAILLLLLMPTLLTLRSTLCACYKSSWPHQK